MQPDNDVWTRALPIALDGSGNGTATGSVDQPGQARWYRFGVTPGSHVSADLTNLATNYDVAIFSDIGQAFRRLTSLDDLRAAQRRVRRRRVQPVGVLAVGLQPLRRSRRRSSARRCSARRCSRRRSSARRCSARRCSRRRSSARRCSARRCSRRRVFSPSVFSRRRRLRGAQVRSLIDGLRQRRHRRRARRGANTWNNTGQFYMRVSGRNGAYAPDAPFDLGVHLDAGTCTGVGAEHAAAAHARRAEPADAPLILADYARMTDDGDLAAMRTEACTTLRRAERGRSAPSSTSVAEPARRSPRRAGRRARGLPVREEPVAEAIRDVVRLVPGARTRACSTSSSSAATTRCRSSAIPTPPASAPSPTTCRRCATRAPRRPACACNYVLCQDAYGAHDRPPAQGETVPGARPGRRPPRRDADGDLRRPRRVHIGTAAGVAPTPDLERWSRATTSSPTPAQSVDGRARRRPRHGRDQRHS